jgi:hypothetical protein
VVAILIVGVMPWVPFISATSFFSDDFEDGTLDAWISSTVSTSCSLTVDETAKYSGNYGLDSVRSIWMPYAFGVITLDSASSSLYTRIDFCLASGGITNGYGLPLIVYRNIANNTSLVYFGIYNSGGTYHPAIYNGSWQVNSSVTISPSTWYTLQGGAEYDASGFLCMLIDGEVTGNSTYSSAYITTQLIWVGQIVAMGGHGTAATVYFDDVEVSDEIIEEESGPTAYFTIGVYDETHYYVYDPIAESYISTAETDFSTALTYALNNVNTEGEEWEKTVQVLCDATISSTFTWSQDDTRILWNNGTTESHIILETAAILFDVTGDHITSIGGNFSGTDTVTHQAFKVEGDNCTIQDAEFSGFDSTLNNRDNVIWLNYLGHYLTVVNCTIHDNGDYTGAINLTDLAGYNNITNCTFYNAAGGIFIEKFSGHNKINGCDFSTWNIGGYGHAIYIGDSNDSIGGFNEISFCTFDSPYGQSAFHIKAPNNLIYNNTFSNFDTAVCFSIYSQGSYANASGNIIANNTATNIEFWAWLGHGVQAQPTYDNTFENNTLTNIEYCFLMHPWVNPSVNWVNDTYILQNSFIDCTYFMPTLYTDNNYVSGIEVGWNVFDGWAPDTDFETNYLNVWVHDNMGM